MQRVQVRPCTLHLKQHALLPSRPVTAGSVAGGVAGAQPREGLELLLWRPCWEGTIVPGPCHSSGRAEAPRGGLLGGPGPLVAAGEAAFSGLWTRMTLAGARASCRRTQTRPPCSAHATPMPPLCASTPVPSPESECLEGLPHRARLVLNA